jgi:hypothetical protein
MSAFFFHCLPLAPSIFLDAAQTHLAPYYIYIYKRTQHVFGHYWTDLGWANGQPGKKYVGIKFSPIIIFFHC